MSRRTQWHALGCYALGCYSLGSVQHLNADRVSQTMRALAIRMRFALQQQWQPNMRRVSASLWPRCKSPVFLALAALAASAGIVCLLDCSLAQAPTHDGSVSYSLFSWQSVASVFVPRADNKAIIMHDAQASSSGTTPGIPCNPESLLQHIENELALPPIWSSNLVTLGQRARLVDAAMHAVSSITDRVHANRHRDAAQRTCSDSQPAHRMTRKALRQLKASAVALEADTYAPFLARFASSWELGSSLSGRGIVMVTSNEHMARTLDTVRDIQSRCSRSSACSPLPIQIYYAAGTRHDLDTEHQQRLSSMEGVSVLDLSAVYGADVVGRIADSSLDCLAVLASPFRQVVIVPANVSIPLYLDSIESLLDAFRDRLSAMRCDVTGGRQCGLMSEPYTGIGGAGLIAWDKSPQMLQVLLLSCLLSSEPLVRQALQIGDSERVPAWVALALSADALQLGNVASVGPTTLD
ncbi:hypothetical protein BC831DRAFT_477003 [Entophlyctis helioformis]|nr:hypothetical protein BC831DRAFT_477003 [Entophlyctis helioformis]